MKLKYFVFIIIIIKYKKGLVSYMSRYEKLLEVRKLHKYYSKDVVSTKALNGISFDVLKGEYLGIMGASGSGKTTLINVLSTIEAAYPAHYISNCLHELSREKPFNPACVLISGERND